MIWTSFRLAVRQLRRNLARTALTSLGVLIGVAAVIAMVSIGQGATQAVNDDLASFGQNLLFVVPGGGHGPGRGAGKPFSEKDVEAIVQEIRGVAAVAPTDSTPTVAAWEEETWRTQLSGTTNEYFRAMRWEIGSGRFFEDGELVSGADVCVLGQTLVEELFANRDPLGATLRTDALTCRVVGTLEPKGQNTFGQDQDDLVVMPLRTFQRRLRGNRDIAMILVSADENADSTRVREDLEALFRERRHIRAGAEADFTVRDMAEVVSMLNNISSVLTGFLAAVAAVSLLVGGIGIMNIMLVSVTERTREIGIRLAIGALARDVLMQFLVEAMVLSGLGGLLGIVTGLVLSRTVSAVLDIPFVVDPLIIVLAFGFSAFIGVVFGFFPARRAAAMKPIDALRHE
ncbi:MAG: ABC transporter permease [Alphaproteobacteria bacterium]|nr:ABC transporter permease [Alphaproteobacteria bacterium]